MDRRSIPYIDSVDMADTRGHYMPLSALSSDSVSHKVLVNGGRDAEIFGDTIDHPGDHPLAEALTMQESLPLRPRSRVKTEGDEETAPVPPFDVTIDQDLERHGRRRNISTAGGYDVPDDGKSEIPEIRGALFQTKKTVAQGLLDIALLTANASQLKNLVETENHPNYLLCMVLLAISISLQLIVAILLLVVGRMDYEPNSTQRKRDNRWIVVWNDISTAGVFFITVVNIFIASFISHGKAYIPPVNAQSSWNEKMRNEKLLYEMIVLKVVNGSA